MCRPRSSGSKGFDKPFVPSSPPKHGPGIYGTVGLSNNLFFVCQTLTLLLPHLLPFIFLCQVAWFALPVCVSVCLRVCVLIYFLVYLSLLLFFSFCFLTVSALCPFLARSLLSLLPFLPSSLLFPFYSCSRPLYTYKGLIRSMNLTRGTKN